MATEPTKAKLLKAAAEAFAQHGYAGASLRKIQLAAGVNSASSHYHYGSKAQLYQGVVRESLEGIVSERIRRMAAVNPALPPRERLTAILKAYMQPHLEVATSKAGADYGHILARQLVEPRSPEVAEVFAELVTPSRQELIRQLMKIFPYASQDRLVRAVGLTVSTMALAPFETIYTQLADRPPFQDREALFEATTHFATAGVLALCGPFAET